MPDLPTPTPALTDTLARTRARARADARVEVTADAPARPARGRLLSGLAMAGLAAIALGTAALVAVSTSIWIERELRASEAERVTETASALAGRVDRLRHLTVAIAGHPDVRALLARDGSLRPEPLATRVDEYLETVARASDASILYVIDTHGLTRAASDANTRATLIGNLAAYRPEFREAMRGREAGFFAVGELSGVAGYYFARPVMQGVRTLGIAVVKVELESLQQRWESTAEPLLLIDEYGVSIAAGQPDRRFRDTRGLDADSRAILRAQFKYGTAPLLPLGSSDANPDGTRLSDEARRLSLDDHDWLVTAIALPDRGWRLVRFASVDPVRRGASLAALATLLLFVLSTVAWLYRRERRRRRALTRTAAEARRMRDLNRQLRQVIAERQRAEADRDVAQADLIQASKLAALGQMSAAVAHEVNQPLSAIRTFAASARLLLERDRPDEVGRNLHEIEELTDRLATVTGELKVFARKPESIKRPVDLAASAARVVAPLAADASSIRLELKMAEREAWVLGDAVRLDQVIGNLLANAMDATADNADERRVDVTLADDGGAWVLHVSDNGHGLDPAALDQLFDPFFTTKPVGQGVGLGLAISYGIVQDMGGSLEVHNRADRGATFTLRLACAIAPREGPLPERAHEAPADSLARTA